VRRNDNHIEEAFNLYDATPMDTNYDDREKNYRGYRTKTIRSGDRVIEFETHPNYPKSTVKHLKERIREYSPEKRKKYHENQMHKNLFRLITENFTDKDVWITYTYRGGVEPKNDNEATHDRKLLRDRLKYEADKEGYAFKYVIITEGSHGKSGTRYHHHVICNFHDLKLAESKWTKGEYPESEHLKVYERGGLERMARYLTEPSKDKPSRRNKHMKGYICSLGLKKPWKPVREGGGMTINDSMVTRKHAELMGTYREDVKAFYEKKKPGYEVISHKIKKSDYAPGVFIWVLMVKRE